MKPITKALLAGLVLLGSLTLMTLSAEPPPTDPAAWAEVERLISEDKYEAASAKVAEIRVAARERGHEADWTRALVKEVQLRMGLHGYETAVHFLRDEAWPEGPRYRLALELFYAQSLVTYSRSYSWEVRQRERVVSTEEVDLKAWTLDQIYGEAHKALRRAWDARQAWGEGSLGDLAEYFEPGNYPAHIRGTLRDAVSYLWVELLADTSMWRPEHANEVFRLDLETLLAGDRAAVALDDPEVHPISKIVAVLDDLETWHRRGGRPEAAFEARLERLRRLNASFSQEDDKKAIRADLERQLDAVGRNRPWWSMGMAQLADLVRGGGAPDALVEARRIALEGERAHAASVGGRRCRHIVASIEQPGYQVAAMQSDGPDRRSLRVRHKNLVKIHFRAYALDLVATVERADDWSLLPRGRAVEQIIARQRPVTQWSVELPETPDYEWHATYVTPPLDRSSLYLIVASARRDFARELNQRTAVALILSDLVLLRTTSEEPVLRVVSGRTGEGLSGVDVALYRHDYRKGHRVIERRTSGEDGEVRFAWDRMERQSHFILARRGEDVALQENVYLQQAGQPRDVGRALLYTDRSIYRPGQKILWKVVAYRQEKEPGKFEILPDTAGTVTLRDANHEEVATVAVSTNRYGSASGEFEIPAGRLLGPWALEATMATPGWERHLAQVRVEEYKRPTFEVEVEDAAGALRLNQPATLSGQVRYYFGLPVTNGDVTWRVTRVPVWPWWYHWTSRIVPGGDAPQTVASGAAELDQDGRFDVTFTPEADERLAEDNVTYTYSLGVDVTDEGGETRSASRSFRLGFVTVEASVEDPPGFFREGEGVALTVVRKDLDGQPRAGTGAWRILELEQPDEATLPADWKIKPPEDAGYRTEGDLLRARWDFGMYSPQAMLRDWPDGDEVGHGEFEHGDDGKAGLSVALEPGPYRLRYSTVDDFGAAYETTYELVVAGASAPLKLPGVLQAERTSVPVGAAARLLVHSGLADQEMELAIYRSGDTERRRLESGPGVRVIEIPVRREDRGGFGVTLTLVRDHQLVEIDQRVFVPWDDRELHLEFATFRDKMRPGQSESWTVTVKSFDEETLAAGTAELLAYMYDKSLDLFASHDPPDPLSLYPRHDRVPGFVASLGQAPGVWADHRDFSRVPANPHLEPDRLKVLSGYGIGGPGGRGGIRKRIQSMAMRQPESAPIPEAVEMKAADTFLESADVEQEAVRSELSPPPPPPPPGAPPAAPAATDALRTDFSETAFWEPHLLAGEDGSVTFEFTVPDSLTEWNVWVHALTRDLRAGRLHEEVRTAKELMVRPYLPRFLREGDRAELKVVVNNAGEEALRGTLDFEIRDPETDESLSAEFALPEMPREEFTVEPGGGAELSFPIRVPPEVRTVAFVVRARAGDWSDGELRPLPVLPSRMHLAQSRFVTLRDRDRRVMRFEDLAADDDPTRIDEQLVVTLDGQLFYSVLHALPYLVNYSYECTEQTLNRFLSTGIVSSLYEDYPAVARMAEQFSERETRYEAWDADDPNRKMALEETPWLTMSRGGRTPEEGLLNVLDPKVATAQREASLAKLRQAQTSSGGFPWWPGGPPSPYMTIYLLDGFSRALEFDVDVPQDMVSRAWAYLHRYYVDRVAREMIAKDCCWETVTYLNYVLSNYPDVSWTGGVFTDDDRRTMLEHSFRHWRKHSPRLKSYLALLLHRAGRAADARLVFDSVMDSAKTTEDLGTFWAPEDRAWLWYNDTIESHAFALRALLELEPGDARRHGLVQWLFLNKHLNHWKSTRATAEVIYSLVHYLTGEGAIAVREEAVVTVGDETRTFTFEPDRYTGKENRILLAGDEVGPEAAEIEVTKETPGFLFASATWHFSTEELPEEARGDFFSVTRKYFRRVHTGREWSLEPLAEGAEISVGDQLEVQLSIRAKHAAEYVHLRDPRGAGFEPETLRSGYRWDLGIGAYEEVRDSGTNFFFEWLPVGEYTFKYRLRASTGGIFRVGPATLQSMYAPEFTGYSSGAELEVSP